MGYSPSGTDCSSVVSLQTISSRKPTSAWPPAHGPQLLPRACSCMGSPWSSSSFRAHPSALAQDDPQAVLWIVTPMWASPWSSGEHLLWHLEHLLTLLHWTWYCQGSFSYIFSHSSLSGCIFYPFLNMFSLRWHHLGWWAQPCPVVGLLKLRELVVCSMGQPLSLFTNTTLQLLLPKPGQLHLIKEVKPQYVYKRKHKSKQKTYKGIRKPFITTKVRYFKPEPVMDMGTMLTRARHSL